MVFGQQVFVPGLRHPMLLEGSVPLCDGRDGREGQEM